MAWNYFRKERIHNLRSSVHQWIHQIPAEAAYKARFPTLPRPAGVGLLLGAGEIRTLREELRLRKIRQQQVEERARKQAIAAGATAF